MTSPAVVDICTAGLDLALQLFGYTPLISCHGLASDSHSHDDWLCEGAARTVFVSPTGWAWDRRVACT